MSSKHKHTIPALAVIATALGLQTAYGTTIDTFSFTEQGWLYTVGLGGTIQTGAADPGGMLTGTFTGTVEPSGFIQQSDLTSFSAEYTDSAGVVIKQKIVTFFSYNVDGGGSSLSFSGYRFQPGFCVGQTIFLLLDCNNIYTYPPGTNGVVAFISYPAVVTTGLPVVTLLGQTTLLPPPPPLTPVSEPASLGLVGAALVGSGTVLRRRRRRHLFT